MENYSYYFLWVILFLNCLGTGVVLAQIGKVRAPITAGNFLWHLIVLIFLGLAVYYFPKA